MIQIYSSPRTSMLTGTRAVEYKEVGLATLPLPFVNPGDAFAQLKRGP